MSVTSNISNAAGSSEPTAGLLAGHQERSLTAVVDAMRCPVRLRLLLSLCTEGPQTVGTLAQRLCLTQPTTSHNLGLLRMNNLVTSRRDGKSVWYEFAADRVECGRRPRADGAPGGEFTVAIQIGAGVVLTLAAHDSPATATPAPACQTLAA
jgi:DNA-binding transcriptional ArsR family regulator